MRIKCACVIDGVLVEYIAALFSASLRNVAHSDRKYQLFLLIDVRVHTFYSNVCIMCDSIEIY